MVAGFRLPLEAEYRDFWELPYPADVRSNLLRHMLQARAVLGWLRNVAATPLELERVRFIPRTESDAAVQAIGGTAGPDVLARAQRVERAIYAVTSALVAPELKDIDQAAISGYEPFDVISEIEVQEANSTFRLRPLVVLDDAHSLHKLQLDDVMRWLLQREIRVARWVLTRMDALTPENVLIGSDSLIPEDTTRPGIQPARDMTLILLQGASGHARARERRQFRTMAQDMANKYLAQMPVFTRRHVRNFSTLFEDVPEPISPEKLRKLEKHVKGRAEKLKLTDEIQLRLADQVDAYLTGAENIGFNADVKLAMMSILMSRYATRTPQRELFDAEPNPEPSRPIKADSSVADRAKIFLMHQYDRPHYFGLDTVCDASSENAERFLRLSETLVDRSETHLIRNRPVALSAREQNDLLRKRAQEIVDEWNFPLHREVRALCDRVGEACVRKLLEDTAPDGPSGVGIPESEMPRIVQQLPRLARVLQYGVAYNAFSLQHNRLAKNQTWCVIELSGALILKHGLTLQRGHFVEWDVDRLLAALPQE